MMNNKMETETQYKDLNHFLAKHNAKNFSNTQTNYSITHTRIGNKELNIFAGSYVIPKEDLSTFYRLYHSHIFEKKQKEYLTEKQQEKGGPIVIDFDFKYQHSVIERQHTESHVIDIMGAYMEELKKIYSFHSSKTIPIYIFEKPNVNRLQDGSMTKDGIHMIIGLKSDHIVQTILRDKMLNVLPELMDLPLINTWDAVLDEGISKGHTNWQLYGSRKPGHEAYELTYYFVATYDSTDQTFEIDEKDIQLFDLKENMEKLSVQYDKHAEFDLNPKILNEYNNHSSNKSKIKKSVHNHKINKLNKTEYDDEEHEYISMNDITNEEMLNRAIHIMLKNIGQGLCEYDVKELHEYTQALPEKYYEPGSHVLNRQVAFALKNTDERLFLSWVKLRSKASDFEYDTIPALYDEWKKFRKTNNDGRKVTKRSIMYWVKKENPEEYENIKKNTVNHYLDKAIETGTEYDCAVVLRHMFKDTYVCVSYEKRGIWYNFKNHRWVPDKRLSLRDKISNDLYNLFTMKTYAYTAELSEYEMANNNTNGNNNENNSNRIEYIKKKISTINTIQFSLLKKTTPKDHIMREAAEIFYDDNFVRQMDSKPYLLCFNNGVVDFENKVFREGYPDDYITKHTRIDYIEYNEKDPSWQKTAGEIIRFMETLFPIEDLNKYMWNHLASCLLGTNKNQTFHVYHGSGSNGKSLLVDLMSETLGEYKGTVPITLVTETRNKIGGTSDEVLKLKGIRYAVMQEPTKGAKLNEGIMKELTGGDPIQARGLYSESEIFVPQFKLAVGTNNLFDIDSNDDGTWRRIRKITFPSKFVDEGEYYEDTTPYVYKKDKELSNKLHSYAPVFAGMLVKKAFETNGIVEDCNTVLEASKQYRKGQDHISAFISDKITKTGDPKHVIKKRSLLQEFTDWFRQEQGAKKIPKGEELYEYMNKKFGTYNSGKNGWVGLNFVRNEDEEEDIIDQL